MHDIEERLRGDTVPSVTVLPDGSVDRRSAIVDTDGKRLTRSALGTEIGADTKTFLTDWHGVEPGGQSVNAARQLHELGAETVLIGHLDHPIFEALPFRTYSMGDPAEIHVYELEDGVIMFAGESTDIETWTFDRVRQTVGPNLDTLFAGDAVLWTNWAAFPHATAAIDELLSLLPDGSSFVIDPGAVETRSVADRRAFLDSLGRMNLDGEIVVSPNRREADLLAAAVGVEDSDRRTVASELREYTSVDAVVVHDRPAATVATTSALRSVPTVEDVEPSRHAGAGDRFSAGVAFGRATGWTWEETLTLGNACATHYLVHGRSGDRTDLQTTLREYPR
ncbi:MAG: PfkB family carbohydrate kinase [Halanaeroarchaeum sp.]